jgi:hypothetical protein
MPAAIPDRRNPGGDVSLLVTMTVQAQCADRLKFESSQPLGAPGMCINWESFAPCCNSSLSLTVTFQLSDSSCQTVTEFWQIISKPGTLAYSLKLY